MSKDRVSRRFYRLDSTNDLLGNMDRGQTAQIENRWNFEVSWEAANKGKPNFYSNFSINL